MVNTFVVMIGLSVALAGSFRSNPLANCPSYLDSKSIRRLEHAITRILPAGDGPLAIERKRLHRLITAYVAGMIRGHDQARMEQFFTVLESGGVVTRPITRQGELVQLGDDEVHVGFDDVTGLYLHLGTRFSYSLYGYLRLIHELSHLSRAVSAAPTIDQRFEHYRSLTLRWLGVYREEVASARDEYRFLRWAYSFERIKKIEQKIREPRVKARFFSRNQKIDHLLGNYEYLDQARLALTVPMRAYVRQAVPLEDYRHEQRFYTRERWRTRYVNRIKSISPWLARHLDRLTAQALHLLERPPLMTKDSSNR